jgi:hypothetical protein
MGRVVGRLLAHALVAGNLGHRWRVVSANLARSELLNSLILWVLAADICRNRAALRVNAAGLSSPTPSHSLGLPVRGLPTGIAAITPGATSPRHPFATGRTVPGLSLDRLPAGQHVGLTTALVAGVMGTCITAVIQGRGGQTRPVMAATKKLLPTEFAGSFTPDHP